MNDEFTARQRAITLRLSGRPVKYICQALGRSPFWFHKWWRRYLESGAEGLYDQAFQGGDCHLFAALRAWRIRKVDT